MRDLLFRPASAAVLAALTFAAMLAGLAVYWPAGLALGLVVGTVAVVAVGRHMAETIEEMPYGLWPDPAPVLDDELAADLDRLHRALDADYDDFARAALLVADTRWASVPMLQRGLRVTEGRARFLLALLEAEGFVGPETPLRPRAVLIAPEHVQALRELLALW